MFWAAWEGQNTKRNNQHQSYTLLGRCDSPSTESLNLFRPDLRAWAPEDTGRNTPHVSAQS